MNMQYFQIKNFFDNIAKLPENFTILPSYLSLFHLLSKYDNRFNYEQLGIQRVSCFSMGDYTGEVSFLDVKELSLTKILVNHPEEILNFKYEKIFQNQNFKIKKIVENGINPIICIGNSVTDILNPDFLEEELTKLISNEVNKLVNNVVLLEETKINFVYMPFFITQNNFFLSAQEISQHLEVVQNVLLKIFGDYVLKEKINLLYGGPINLNNFHLNENYGWFIDHGYDLELVLNVVKQTSQKLGNEND